MTLYRPVGAKEFKLIEESNFSEFPPRLPCQPLFYPVTNEKYAEEIAKRWNTNDANSENKGYVTRFEINDSFAEKFEVHTVGASYHQELWVPAEELNTFNQHILGKISVIKSFE